MATLAVLALLVSIGVPSLIGAVRSVRLTSATNDFLAHLHLARSEAIKRNERIVLCKSADGEICRADGDFGQGWIVFRDMNNNGLHEPAEPILQRQERLNGELRVNGNGSVARYVSFTPQGSTKLVGGGFQAGTITVCRQSLERTPARQIVLNAVGRPRVAASEVNSCT